MYRQSFRILHPRYRDTTDFGRIPLNKRRAWVAGRFDIPPRLRSRAVADSTIVRNVRKVASLSFVQHHLCSLHRRLCTRPKHEQPDRSSLPAGLRGIGTSCYWWRYNLRPYPAGAAWEVHGYIRSRADAGTSHWTSRWWLSDRRQGMEMAHVVTPDDCK